MISTQHLKPRLERFGQELAAWRRNGHHHHRTPEPVWQEAVELARTLGVSPVAEALRLNYTGLKRRLNASRTASGRPPTFVELQCAPAVPASECRVCLQDPAGGQMNVVMSTPDLAVLRELAQAFWHRS